MKNLLWEPSYSIRTDGHTNMTKLIVAFRNFAKASEKIGNSSIKWDWLQQVY